MKNRPAKKRKKSVEHNGIKVVQEFNPWFRLSIIGIFSFLISLLIGVMVLGSISSGKKTMIKKTNPLTEFAPIERNSLKYIEIGEVIEKLKSDPNSIVLVDLRSDKDFRAGHIAQALNLTEITPESLELIGMKYQSKLIVLYAASSSSNEPFEAYELMKQSDNIRILIGGLEAWKKSIR